MSKFFDSDFNISSENERNQCWLGWKSSWGRKRPQINLNMSSTDLSAIVIFVPLHQGCYFKTVPGSG